MGGSTVLSGGSVYFFQSPVNVGEVKSWGSDVTPPLTTHSSILTAGHPIYYKTEQNYKIKRTVKEYRKGERCSKLMKIWREIVLKRVD
jgi:mevalonate pyrophosphate decarboxylase